MLRLLQCEYIKLKHSKIFLIGLLGTLIVPLFVIGNAVINSLSQTEAYLSSLSDFYGSSLMFLMLLFEPLVLTVMGAWMISREYTDGTMKNIFVIPVSHTFFLTGKSNIGGHYAFLYQRRGIMRGLIYKDFSIFYKGIDKKLIAIAVGFTAVILCKMGNYGGLLASIMLP